METFVVLFLSQHIENLLALTFQVAFIFNFIKCTKNMKNDMNKVRNKMALELVCQKKASYAKF